jgi:hypothetical protein
VERKRSFDDYEKLCHYFNVTPAAGNCHTINLFVCGAQLHIFKFFQKEAKV